LTANNLKEDRQLERLKYIDLCAYVLGSVKRKMLIDRFGISGVYASKDFAQYQSESNARLKYDNTLKQYVPVDWFTPLYEHNTHDALMLISKGTQYIVCEPALFRRLHEYEIPRTEIDLTKIAPVLRATYRTKKAEIKYISRSSGRGTRLIVPHSVLTVGNFYYLRAFDHKTGEFRNFKLNRIMESTFHNYEPEPRMMIEADIEWQSKLSVSLVPNHGHKHPEALEIDYGLVNGEITLSVRKAMLHYFLMDWNIAPSGYTDLPSELFPLQVSKIGS
jgi:hypothetical protein